MQNDSEANPALKARAKLKSVGIAVKRKNGNNITFIIPKGIEERLKKEYNFNFEMLTVGGDIPLSELAVHVDEQSSMEAYASMLAENARYQLELAREEYEQWFESLCFKCRSHLNEKFKSVTEKLLTGYVYTKYSEKIKIKKKRLIELEYAYRMLDRVIRSAIVTKGVMLPTLRNIVQGRDGIGIGDNKISQNTRKKLKIKKGVSPWQ